MKENLSLKIFITFIVLGFFLITIFISLFISLVYPNLKNEIYLILFLVIIFLFLFSFAISQKFTKPIKKLIWGAGELRRGKLETRVYLGTKDELEDLAKFFNQIAEDLEKSHLKTKKAMEIVDIKIRAKTLELVETIRNLKQKVQEKTGQFERFKKLDLAREQKMIELKEEIKKIKEELKKYKNEKKDKN